jgi:hypothetical protein
LAADPADADIFLVTSDIYGSAGAIFEYKFVINQAGTQVWEGNVGPSGPNGNRTFTLADGSQALPVVFFNNLDTDPGAGILVTFAVNLEVQAALGLFNPDFDTVVVAGEFNNWSTTDAPLTNTVEEPYIYRDTYAIKAAPGSATPYKFVVSGAVWEDGDNRTFELAEEDQTLPLVFFNRQDNLGPLSVGPVSDGQLTLEWTAAPGIRLQTSSGLTSEWQDVPNTMGQGSATVTVQSGDAFFRLAGP